MWCHLLTLEAKYYKLRVLSISQANYVRDKRSKQGTESSAHKDRKTNCGAAALSLKKRRTEKVCLWKTPRKVNKTPCTERELNVWFLVKTEAPVL